jgi:hypothetical protein
LFTRFWRYASPILVKFNAHIFAYISESFALVRVVPYSIKHFPTAALIDKYSSELFASGLIVHMPTLVVAVAFVAAAVGVVDLTERVSHPALTDILEIALRQPLK